MKYLRKLKTYGGHFDIDSKKDKINELEKEMNATDFWNDKEKAEKTITEISNLKKITEDIDHLKENVTDSIEMLALEDNEILKEIENSLESYQKIYDELEMNLLLDDEYDHDNCIVDIHPGAGGTESCDWALMLYRMYSRWCEKKGYKVEALNYQEGDTAGIKNVSFIVKGQNTYGLLKNEKGVHRLVRLSPFDSNNRRHTSFVSVDVTPDIDQDLDIVIDDKDLKIDVYRSTGAGGQGVNTTDSAVRITHLPTKIVVTCQNERSQLQNKEQALKVLKNKLILLEREKQENEMHNIKGEEQDVNFGSQIRSYVLHPYSMVKDHRTNLETSNVNKVLDGDIDEFILSTLKGGRR